MITQPSIAPSARRHNISDESIRHAFKHPIRILDLEDGFTMFLGPDSSANLLEIGVVDTVGGPVIVHAMPARLKFWSESHASKHQ